MNRHARFLVAIAAALLPLAAGCGKPAGSIRGSVSYDGRPVARGAITFFPEDGKGPDGGGAIADGRYEAVDSHAREETRADRRRQGGQFRPPRRVHEPRGEGDLAEGRRDGHHRAPT